MSLSAGTRIGPYEVTGSLGAKGDQITQALGRAGERMIEEISGHHIQHTYSPENRVGDHICYISDLGRLRADYPEWDVRVSLDEIFDDLARTEA